MRSLPRAADLDPTVIADIPKVSVRQIAVTLVGRMCLHPDRPRVLQLMAGYITVFPAHGDVIGTDRIETIEIEPFLESLQLNPARPCV